jgi:hypothetical protein
MAVRVALVLSVGAASACRDSGDSASTNAGASARATSPSGLAKGAEIVAATAPVSFRQGNVVSVQGGEVTFEYGLPDRKTRKRATATVPSPRVWPTGVAAKARVGQHAICRLMVKRGNMPPLSNWKPCTIRQKVAGAYRVGMHDGSERQLDALAIVLPSEETQKAIASYIAAEAKHRSFDEAFSKAGMPGVPEGWTPSTGDAVVAPFIGASWYAAVVLTIDAAANTARIRWLRKDWKEHDVKLERLAPNPSPPATTASGRYIIARPKDDQGRWDPARVVGVRGKELTVESRTGERRLVETKDAIAFGG